MTTGFYELDQFGQIVIITDPGGDPTNPNDHLIMSSNTRKFLTAKAFNAAANIMNNEVGVRFLANPSQAPFSDTEANTFFIEKLNEELEKVMTGITISNGSCNGNIGSGRPAIGYFGFCFEVSCEC